MSKKSIIDTTNQNQLTIKHLLLLVIISLVVGFRYEVGTDWASYKDHFYTIKLNPSISFFEQSAEPGFFFINKAIVWLNLGHQWMFFCASFIAWFLIFKSTPHFILPLLLFFLFTEEYFFWSMNGVRQFIALAVFAFSLRYLISRSLKKYLFLIVLASLFHYSAFIFVIFYYVPVNKLYNKHLWLIIYVLSVLFSFSGLKDTITSQTILFLTSNPIIVPAVYFEHIERGTFITREADAGLGFYFKIIINLFLLLFSSVIIKKHPKTVVYFFLFFVGSVLYNFFYEIQLMKRVIHYFLFFRPFVLAFTVYDLGKSDKNRFLAVILIVLYFVLLLFIIYGGGGKINPFRFEF